MNRLARRVQRTYLVLILGNTLAASFIWGINTLFLLDAGLTNLEAFAANAFFTAGMVVFEIPTGVVADAWGRRTSYLLGTVVLAASTFLYYLLWQTHAPFWQWAAVSVLLGLGFTFFSGAVEAWLVDALAFAEFEDSLEAVFGRAQVVGGAAMLAGSVAGGYIAQVTSLGVPYLIRVATLGLMFVVAAVFMKDLGHVREAEQTPVQAIRTIVVTSLDHGLRNPPVRWLMLAAPFTSGVGFYAFYAMQPFLLELYGNTGAYGIAGLAAAIIACSQMLGGLLAPRIRRMVRRRTSALIVAVVLATLLLALLGITHSFVLALLLLVLWGMSQAAALPVRQAYLNDLIPSRQRATVLSFDSLMGSSGGVVVQPVLGRAADAWGYGPSYLVGAVIQLVAVPFLYRSRREHDDADLSVRP
ncbi:MFS transporter [Cellulomonas sp. KRMCY2]|uniref:MFS transporter n=1 Tax=Cellulomonas sp. KRMCY2 TaxID=1304865 RepID=UPI00045EB82D|nr:MFS transporter [Cellulomonas sp. KRMCY2]